MKNLVILLMIASCTFSCKQEDMGSQWHVTEGIYWGRINYKGMVYFSQISFEKGTFREHASGGVYSQKPFSCLTEGKYKVKPGGITFKPGTSPQKDALCIPEMEIRRSFKAHMYPIP